MADNMTITISFPKDGPTPSGRPVVKTSTSMSQKMAPKAALRASVAGITFELVAMVTLLAGPTDVNVAWRDGDAEGLTAAIEGTGLKDAAKDELRRIIRDLPPEEAELFWQAALVFRREFYNDVEPHPDPPTMATAIGDLRKRD